MHLLCSQGLTSPLFPSLGILFNPQHCGNNNFLCLLKSLKLIPEMCKSQSLGWNQHHVTFLFWQSFNCNGVFFEHNEWENFWNPSIYTLQICKDEISQASCNYHTIYSGISLSSHDNQNAITQVLNMARRSCSHLDVISRWLHDSWSDIKMSIQFSPPPQSTQKSFSHREVTAGMSRPPCRGSEITSDSSLRWILGNKITRSVKKFYLHVKIVGATMQSPQKSQEKLNADRLCDACIWYVTRL